MNVLGGKILVVAGLSALLLSVGALLPASPASAAPPVNAHHYPMVPGVDGSSASIHELDVNLPTKLQVVADLAPAVMVGTGDGWTPMTVTEARIAKVRRNYVQVSGEYCKNKTGGDVFKADGAPTEQGLTCP